MLTNDRISSDTLKSNATFGDWRLSVGVVDEDEWRIECTGRLTNYAKFQPPVRRNIFTNLQSDVNFGFTCLSSTDFLCILKWIFSGAVIVFKRKFICDLFFRIHQCYFWQLCKMSLTVLPNLRFENLRTNLPVFFYKRDLQKAFFHINISMFFFLQWLYFGFTTVLAHCCQRYK